MLPESDKPTQAADPASAWARTQRNSHIQRDSRGRYSMTQPPSPDLDERTEERDENLERIMQKLHGDR